MNISIEIVARDEQQVNDTLLQITQHCPSVNTINVPDILRYKIRSWEAVRLARPHFQRIIPHIRAIDFDLHKPFHLAERLEADQVKEIIVISGDMPRSTLHTVYPTTSVALIRKLKQELPHLTIFAGVDPYRSGVQHELRYTQEKLDAGADGLFTQPFFDWRFMEIYADALPKDIPIYWGVSPVLTTTSKGYWETVNQVVFPADFQLTLDWNRAFAKTALDFARAQNGNIYFMPLRADVGTYLSGIL